MLIFYMMASRGLNAGKILLTRDMMKITGVREVSHSVDRLPRKFDGVSRYV
jgi:hypothetical protein